MRECPDCGFYTARPVEDINECPMCGLELKAQQEVQMKRENQAAIDMVNEIKRLSDANVEQHDKMLEMKRRNDQLFKDNQDLQEQVEELTEQLNRERREASRHSWEHVAALEEEKRELQSKLTELLGREWDCLDALDEIADIVRRIPNTRA